MPPEPSGINRLLGREHWQSTLERIFPALDQSRKEIRVLELHSGWGLTKLHGTLVRSRLDTTKRSDRYCAISYAWGATREPTHVIVISGFDFPISKRQSDVLRAVRSAKRTVRVWIDFL